MAWIKKIEHQTHAAIASYWDSISVFWNKRIGTTQFIVGGWVNKQAYDEGKEPLMTFTWEIPSGSNQQLSAAAELFLESYAKRQPEFEGSHDA